VSVGPANPQIRVHARAQLPTKHGELEIVAFEDRSGVRLDHVAVLCGDVAAQDVATRVHSECLTGDVFDSLRCDCRDQLELALRRIAQEQRGLVLYLRQEGRGIGIAAKVAAYALQDDGLDTVDANLHLGFDDDLRTYENAAAMLTALGVQSIVLHTNNPRKVEGLRAHGIEVVKRMPIIAGVRPQTERYLEAKRKRMGHELP
jgi:GTP cyclohydrolase II